MSYARHDGTHAQQAVCDDGLTAGTATTTATRGPARRVELHARFCSVQAFSESFAVAVLSHVSNPVGRWRTENGPPLGNRNRDKLYVHVSVRVRTIPSKHS